MMIRAFTAAVLLCGAACAEQDYLDQADPVTVSTHKPPATNIVETLSDQPTKEIAGSADCEVSLDVEPESACTMACDPEGLLETYVPEGMCAMYECTLRDGSPIRVGGCNF